jgi:uncharacterized protein YpmB
MRKHILSGLMIVMLMLGVSTSSSIVLAQSSSEPVKKSSSGICHAPGTTYYNQTKKFTPYKTLDECLKSGGRLPKK